MTFSVKNLLLSHTKTNTMATKSSLLYIGQVITDRDDDIYHELLCDVLDMYIHLLCNLKLILKHYSE